MAFLPYFCRMNVSLNGSFAWQARSLFSPFLCFCDVIISDTFKNYFNRLRLWMIQIYNPLRFLNTLN